MCCIIIYNVESLDPLRAYVLTVWKLHYDKLSVMLRNKDLKSLYISTIRMSRKCIC